MKRPAPRGHSGGRRIALEVTQEIITNAIRSDSSHCVIADALQAAVPDARRVSVDLATIRFSDPISRKRYVYLTPAAAQAVLVNFDQGINPEPFTLLLNKPVQIVKQGRMRTAEDIAKRDAEHPKMPKGRNAKVVKVDPTKGTPTVIGGRTPPHAALSSTHGRRRTFGLRTLKP